MNEYLLFKALKRACSGGGRESNVRCFSSLTTLQNYHQNNGPSFQICDDGDGMLFS